MKRLPLVYIAGPFRGRSSWQMEQNIRRAEELALLVWQAGAACICPHANTRFFQGECDDSIWLEGDLEILYRCDALLLTPDWAESAGARIEHETALRLGISVFYDIFNLRVWLDQRKTSLAVEARETAKIAQAAQGTVGPGGCDCWYCREKLKP